MLTLAVRPYEHSSGRSSMVSRSSISAKISVPQLNRLAYRVTEDLLDVRRVRRGVCSEGNTTYQAARTLGKFDLSHTVSVRRAHLTSARFSISASSVRAWSDLCFDLRPPSRSYALRELEGTVEADKSYLRVQY